MIFFPLFLFVSLFSVFTRARVVEINGHDANQYNLNYKEKERREREDIRKGIRKGIDEVKNTQKNNAYFNMYILFVYL